METQLATFLAYSPLIGMVIGMGSAAAFLILYKANQMRQLRVESAGSEAEDDHPTPTLYAQIAGILLIITIIEVVVVIIDIGTLILIPVLLILSAIKFGFVIGYYMHLKFDHKLFSTMFLGGLFLAIGVMAALIGLFGNFTLPSDTVLAESSSHEKHHLTHVDSPLMTVLGLSGSDDGHSEESASASSGSLTITSGESGVEFAFAPATVELSAGESVQLIFDNKGTIAHDFAIPELGFAIESTDAGQSGSGTLAVPATPGTYDFICSIPGHKEAGMVGQIVIN
ncbi:MAG: cytochrome C oxidase subunit IV family protein [Chloroflexota bacterium]|nr:cytochrome C oxidase subunit IV family protein [Chloroflexota bacterium]